MPATTQTRPRNLLIRAIATIALLVTTLSSARADRHDFPFTYDWNQTAAGEHEIEAHSTYLKSDTSFEEELEYEYGVSERFSIAPYVVFERGPGESLHYSGFQVETRYKLVPFKTNRVLSGLYEEYAKHKDGDSSLESRIVLSRYGTDGSDLSFNFVLVNDLTSHPAYEKIYSVGYAVPIGRSPQSYRGGAEWIHNLTDGRINFGPVFGMETSKSTSIVLGYAFKLNSRDGNDDEARAIVEYEF